MNMYKLDIAFFNR